MHSLKSSSFLRSSSRPPSPLPNTPISRADTDISVDRATRYHTKLSLSNFRKASPAPVRESTPLTLVQDGSYMDALSLKLTEAVAKTLTQPVGTAGAGDVVNGKRPLPSGRGRALGSLIATELNASSGNSLLQRAILRSLQRPLSALVSTMSSNLIPLVSSPSFLDPPTPTILHPNSNAVQLHALGLARVAGEVLETFDQLELGLSNDPREDGLRAIRDNLNSLITRVVNPLFTGIKNDTCAIIQALEKPNPASNNPKHLLTNKSSPNQHPSLASLQTLMPLYAKALTRYTVAPSCCATIATLLISLIWRGLVALSHRPLPPSSRPNSINAPANTAASSSKGMKKRLASATSTTPPSTPPPSRFAIKLPPSRPPSPPSAVVPSVGTDAVTFYNLLNLLPRPKDVDETNRVAQEAVEEAFEALTALAALLEATNPENNYKDDLDLDVLTSGLPTLIALPVLLRWAGHGEPQRIPMMLGLTDIEYREGCISGFGRAEEYAGAAGQRILNILTRENPEDRKTKMVITWLQAKIIAANSN